jgi:hypothetical protein
MERLHGQADELARKTLSELLVEAMILNAPALVRIQACAEAAPRKNAGQAS